MSTDRFWANVFPDAHPHVKGLKDFRWHTGADRPNSSQALCLSAWGTLARRRKRAAILTAVYEGAGISPGVGDGPPQITCEDQDPALLNEFGRNSTPTSIDVSVRWGDSVLAIESKLGEFSFGHCGQTKAARKGLPAACDGRHFPGSDRKTKTNAACRLQIWDGDRSPRLYWDIGSELFRPDVLIPADAPCPFAGPSFQLMRNLCWAAAAARPRRDRRPWFGLLVVHVGAHPNATGIRQELETFRGLLIDELRSRVGILDYETLSDLLRKHGEEDLASDIERRIGA